MALAQGAKEYRLCRPQMTPENVISIQGGRYGYSHLHIVANIVLTDST